ncbi:hypothetical protein EVAR_60692_1 [Eumeta japonica]|uniref:Uncharacterized protein n=1 Tax=Eumeta variegata TaxID=151549 RepID=A0A4C1ZF31_EUMVA|nr:hypothetical protein EVAR_60692_1 [Eumeta japonica]
MEFVAAPAQIESPAEKDTGSRTRPFPAAPRPPALRALKRPRFKSSAAVAAARPLPPAFSGRPGRGRLELRKGFSRDAKLPSRWSIFFLPGRRTSVNTWSRNRAARVARGGARAGGRLPSTSRTNSPDKFKTFLVRATSPAHGRARSAIGAFRLLIRFGAARGAGGASRGGGRQLTSFPAFDPNEPL